MVGGNEVLEPHCGERVLVLAVTSAHRFSRLRRGRKCRAGSGFFNSLLGVKAHIGVDVGSGLVRTVIDRDASVNGLTQETRSAIPA